MVDEDDSGRAAAPEGGGSAPPRRRSTGRSRPPLWRQGRFWVAVIALEVVIALALSFALERSSTDVDLAGADIEAFCAQAQALRDQAGSDPVSSEDPTHFEREAAGYRSLIESAPDDLVADLEKLADLDDQLAQTARDIAAKKAEDPSYSGLVDLNDALEQAGAQGKVAGARVDVVLQSSCGIVPGAGTSTTPPPATAIEGPRPSSTTATGEPVPGTAVTDETTTPTTAAR